MFSRSCQLPHENIEISVMQGILKPRESYVGCLPMKDLVLIYIFHSELHHSSCRLWQMQNKSITSDHCSCLSNPRIASSIEIYQSSCSNIDALWNPSALMDHSVYISKTLT